MNNNTIIDRFEDDRLPDYPLRARPSRLQCVTGGLKITESSRLTVGRLAEHQLSSDRESRSFLRATDRGKILSRARHIPF